MFPVRPILIVAGLFAIALILKWSCRLIFGLLDYALLIGMIAAVIWYIRLSDQRKKGLKLWAKNNVKIIVEKLKN